VTNRERADFLWSVLRSNAGEYGFDPIARIEREFAALEKDWTQRPETRAAFKGTAAMAERRGIERALETIGGVGWAYLEMHTVDDIKRRLRALLPDAAPEGGKLP
jgi:hypothetical protein